MFLAKHGDTSIRDEDFADFYHPTEGRPSEPPSILMCTLLLQMFGRVSDGEATRFLCSFCPLGLHLLVTMVVSICSTRLRPSSRSASAGVGERGFRAGLWVKDAPPEGGFFAEGSTRGRGTSRGDGLRAKQQSLHAEPA